MAEHKIDKIRTAAYQGDPDRPPEEDVRYLLYLLARVERTAAVWQGSPSSREYGDVIMRDIYDDK